MWTRRWLLAVFTMIPTMGCLYSSYPRSAGGDHAIHAGHDDSASVHRKLPAFSCYVPGDRTLLSREGRRACHAEAYGAVGRLRRDVSKGRQFATPTFVAARCRLYRLCANVCDACAQECEAMKDDERMLLCAQTCRDCATHCREMSKLPV